MIDCVYSEVRVRRHTLRKIQKVDDVVSCERISPLKFIWGSK